MRPGTHAAIATLLLCAATVSYTHHMPEFRRFFSGHNDFLLLYTGGRLAGTTDMYDVEAAYREEDQTVGFHIRARYHDRFPWQAIVMSPLARLPYMAAFWLWIGMNLVCFAIIIRFWLLPRDYVLWGAVFLPAAASIIVGQDSLMVAACMAGVLLLASRGHDVKAGLLLALCTAKPHLFLLIPFALLAQRRWKLIASASAGVAGLLVISTGVAGFDWPTRMFAVVKTLAQDTGPDFRLRPSLFQLGVNGATIATAVVLAAALCVAIWRMRSVETALAVAMLGSILVAPHASVYDLPLLLIALPAMPLRPLGRWLRIALLTPVPYWALTSGWPWTVVVPVLLMAIIAATAWHPGLPASPVDESRREREGDAVRLKEA